MKLTNLEVALEKYHVLNARLIKAKGDEFAGCKRQIIEHLDLLERLVNEPEPSLSPFESVIEARLYELLEQMPVPASIVCQYQVGRFRLDLAYPDYKIGIECDGLYYHSEPNDVEYDEWRDAQLRSQGWQILRFTGADVKHRLGYCVLDTLKALKGRGCRLPLTL